MCWSVCGGGVGDRRAHQDDQEQKTITGIERVLVVWGLVVLWDFENNEDVEVRIVLINSNDTFKF